MGGPWWCTMVPCTWCSTQSLSEETLEMKFGCQEAKLKIRRPRLKVAIWKYTAVYTLSSVEWVWSREIFSPSNVTTYCVKCEGRKFIHPTAVFSIWACGSCSRGFGLPVTWLTSSETDRLVPCWAAVRLSGPWCEFWLFLENLNIESCILTPWSEITHFVHWSVYRHCTYLFKGDKLWLSL